MSTFCCNKVMLDMLTLTKRRSPKVKFVIFLAGYNPFASNVYKCNSIIIFVLSSWISDHASNASSWVYNVFSLANHMLESLETSFNFKRNKGWFCRRLNLLAHKIES